MDITNKEVEAIAFITQLAADSVWGVTVKGGQAASDFLRALNVIDAVLKRYKQGTPQNEDGEPVEGRTGEEGADGLPL